MSATAAKRDRIPKSNTSVGLTGNLLIAVTAMGASQQSIQLQQTLKSLEAYSAVPTYRSNRDRRRERFAQLAQRWRADTQCLSSTTEIAMHPSHQAIIGMGPDALPMILEDLQVNSGYWYWALKSISNEDPVAPRDRGVIKKMKIAWLRWGQIKGLMTI